MNQNDLQGMKSIFRISGADCANEVAAIKKALSGIGLQSVSVNLMESTATVYHPSDIDIRTIRASIESTGVVVVDQKESSFTSANKSRLALVVSSGSFLGLGIFLEWTEKATDPLLMIIFGIATLLGGSMVFPKALRALRQKSLDMNVLMSLAVIGAFAIREYSEAATVTVLFSLSHLLESWSVERARKATKALLALVPDTARVLEVGGNEKVIQATEVKVGQIFVVKTGERVPLDGIVLKGSSEIDQAPITGESVPVSKNPGDSVFSGTINGNGVLEVKCEKISQNSTLSNIVRLVSQAHEQRAPSEQWVERFAKIYTPIVIALAFLVLVVPVLFFSGAWNEWLYRSLTLLVIACPCALVISTPVSIVAALTAAAKNGVLVKGGKFMELPAHIKAIAFDKTGTITKGELTVLTVVPFNEHTEQELLEIASAIEVRSEHPIAKAIVVHARSQGVVAQGAENYTAVQGKGATALISGKKYWLGSHRFLEEMGQESADVHSQLESLMNSGHTVVVIGTDTHVCGFITLSDTLRPESKSAIASFHALGIKNTVMLTGDNRGTAELISRKVGIDRFFAELLPEDKVKKIEELVEEHKVVAMIGDGVNDAPAMARASLGIAMGVAGSDAAIESADIALMTDDLSKIPWLIQHSKRTLQIIRQNIFFSLAIKAVFVILTFVGLSSLWAAIAADMGASLIVIFNGLRLLNLTPTAFPKMTESKESV